MAAFFFAFGSDPNAAAQQSIRIFIILALVLSHVHHSKGIQ